MISGSATSTAIRCDKSTPLLTALPPEGSDSQHGSQREIAHLVFSETITTSSLLILNGRFQPPRASERIGTVYREDGIKLGA